ncbi:hypothetical protein FRX31_030522 [Thalictrum thalictroides]|uniref:CCHC-type domain-containing protein n=1 Tax=Thalictrum thalictroides TaxID=46969 RepID=A0A7J6V592_THATH|nr:hypothetical protein FRX31_030522 [Thalictrum thalictroides]
MNHLNLDPNDFVSTWYHAYTTKKAYEKYIEGINGPDMWQPTEYEVIHPPLKRRKPGRPKKARRREMHEDHGGTKKVLTRKGKTVKCKNCGQPGHNKRSCRNAQVAPAGPSTNGSKRKEPSTTTGSKRKEPSTTTNSEGASTVVERPTKLPIRRGTSNSGNVIEMNIDARLERLPVRRGRKSVGNTSKVTNRRKGKDKTPCGFGILLVADGAIYVRRGRYIPPDINDDQGPSQTDASTPASQTPTSQVTNLPTPPPPAPVRKSPPPKATKPPLPTRWSLRKTAADALLDFQSTTTPTTLPRRSPRKGKQVQPTPTITPRSLGKGKQGAKKSHTMMKGGFFLG